MDKAGSEPARAGNHLSLVPAPSEKRAGGHRNTVMIPATIVCSDGATHACVIRDMSATGAKLAISRRHRLPVEFALAVPGRDGVYAVARKWQRGDFAGVVLVLPERDAGKPEAGEPVSEKPASEKPDPAT